MLREIKVGTVSWIDGRPNPMWSAAQAAALEPEWIPKTYLGLAATSNPAPPDSLSDFPGYQRAKNFRSLTYCRFQVEVDDTTRQLTSFRVLEAAHDGGWTPPFRMRDWPSTTFAFDTSIYSFTWYQGEYSPLSLVNTQHRHANTTISSVPQNETVLVNSLIKFRAGSHTDNIGINHVGSPYHVPWVWCELLLTFAQGTFKMYGHASIFPSHAWYFDANKVNVQPEIGDASFPSNPLIPTWVPRPPGVPFGTATNPFSINERALRMYPILSAGASATGPQTPLAGDAGRAGAVDSHPNTASGGNVWSKAV